MLGRICDFFVVVVVVFLVFFRFFFVLFCFVFFFCNVNPGLEIHLLFILVNRD